MNAQPQRKKILLIDDDPDTVFALSLVLTHAGYEVRDAFNGTEGLKMAMEEKPDLILLDFFMPEKNGFETCGELRQIPDLKCVPIVAMTAFGQDIGETHGMSRFEVPTQVQDYLEKPFDPNVLLERVSLAMQAAC